MPWVTNEQLAEARRVDLLTYLQEREPQELVRSASGEYRTKSQGSLVISHGAWYWNRGQFGGRSALDYLVKVQGLSLMDAAETVSGVRAPSFSPSLPVNRPETKREAKPLILPPQTKYPRQLLAYLQGRGIGADVIRQCLDNGSLFEGRYQGEAVCVFVGRDESGTARFGCMRGINSDLKRDCSGSDKLFSFSMTANDTTSSALAAFEAPIDVQSHATLYPDWSGHRLSLGGSYTGPNTMPQIQYTPAVNPAQPHPATMTRRIGGTTYRVNVHFGSTSKETVNDKILRLVKREAVEG